MTWSTKSLTLWDVTDKPTKLHYGVENIELWKRLDNGWYGGSIVIVSQLPSDAVNIGTELVIMDCSDVINPHIFDEDKVVMRFNNCRKGNWNIPVAVATFSDDVVLRQNLMCDIWIMQ